jgi:bifunctional polynucleotide phosphatase/kinase
VASFFTPTSQKAPEKIIWQERGADEDSPRTLIVGKYQPTGLLPPTTIDNTRNKVAAFDFVSLVMTS